jgi:hypothetical protein
MLWPAGTAGREDPASPVSGTSRLVPMSPARAKYVLEEVIEGMAKQSLRTLGLAYRDFASRAELPASWLADADKWTNGEALLEEVRVCVCLRARDVSFMASSTRGVPSCRTEGVCVRAFTHTHTHTPLSLSLSHTHTHTLSLTLSPAPHLRCVCVSVVVMLST